MSRVDRRSVILLLVGNIAAWHVPLTLTRCALALTGGALYATLQRVRMRVK